MDPRQLAEAIAHMIIAKGYVYDEDVADEFGADEFELIKAKNVLIRYYGIAVEKWRKEGEESRQAMFLSDEFAGDDAAELVHRVFHDPAFKTRRRRREEERKSEIRGEVRELFVRLQEEWGDLFGRGQGGG